MCGQQRLVHGLGEESLSLITIGEVGRGLIREILDRQNPEALDRVSG
jgi:hypothetical protein